MTVFRLFGRFSSEAVLTLQGQSVQDLFAMTPYYWNTPADGAARLAACESLTTEIGFRFLVYKKGVRRPPCSMSAALPAAWASRPSGGSKR